MQTTTERAASVAAILTETFGGSIGAVTGVAGLFWLVAGVVAIGAREVPGLQNLDNPGVPPPGKI